MHRQVLPKISRGLEGEHLTAAPSEPSSSSTHGDGRMATRPIPIRTSSGLMAGASTSASRQGNRVSSTPLSKRISQRKARQSNEPPNRSEERRVGRECVSTCRSRGTTEHSKKNSNHIKEN